MTAVLSPQRVAQVCEGIRAALDEWEREAKAATPGPWTAETIDESDRAVTYLRELWSRSARSCVLYLQGPGAPSRADATFIASHSPDCVLVQIADYRARVDECEAVLSRHTLPHDRCQGGWSRTRGVCADSSRAFASLRRLADLTGVDSGDE